MLVACLYWFMSVFGLKQHREKTFFFLLSQWFIAHLHKRFSIDIFSHCSCLFFKSLVSCDLWQQLWRMRKSEKILSIFKALLFKISISFWMAKKIAKDAERRKIIFISRKYTKKKWFIVFTLCYRKLPNFSILFNFTLIKQQRNSWR